MNKLKSCDIFCNVVDNYGDIGVCWRLARLLAQEHGLAVRLWVDDLVSMQKLCPEVDAHQALQHCRGVDVRHWPVQFPEIEPAQLVIEAFACELPERYVAAMALQRHKPVWINLEYLSAEDWVEECHKLPSPHPRLPLVKYFFFPGFTPQTGGLMLERDLLDRRIAFERDSRQQRAFWQSLGMETPSPATLKISLFAYENAALAGLFDAWAASPQPVLCLVPEGRILPEVRQYFKDAASLESPLPLAGVPKAGNPQSSKLDAELSQGPGERASYSRGNLTVCTLPFVEQERYDLLLWACDINFVRGEDSCVRAQWAGRPFVWQIYPQHDAVHWDKLQAFLKLYQAPLSPAASQAVQGLWREWNNEGQAGQAWPAFATAQTELTHHAENWARHLAENNLVLNLLDFCQKSRIIQPLQN
ncbi:MAG TPA: elongation factor P maturation arginine rhamnosyltransferase EarP [Gallionella sp.]|nr:elongation factor P maturation arginine rhamnosyltransferase EarP [Gallionella sp.]